MYKKGYIQVYTGDGKGKTTAAFGQALRAACAGNRVFIAQFMKKYPYNEIKVTDYIPNIIIEQFGDVCFVGKEPSEKDYELSAKALKRVKEVFESNNFDMVILDEVNMAIYMKLIKVEELRKILLNKPVNVEVILTGRYADNRIICIADLVTEMKEIKHYYTKGVKARNGIER